MTTFRTLILFPVALLGPVACDEAAMDLAETGAEDMGGTESEVDDEFRYGNFGPCPGGFRDCRSCTADHCGQVCCYNGSAGPFGFSYPDRCDHYVPNEIIDVPGEGLICEVDRSPMFHGALHMVTIHAVDLKEKASCGDGEQFYEKRVLAREMCATPGGDPDSGECNDVIEAKIAEFSAGGEYRSIVRAYDLDWCPTAAVPACLSDSECDDGRFCNGQETCEEGRCQAGPRPCTAWEICDEARDRCEFEGPPCNRQGSICP